MLLQRCLSVLLGYGLIMECDFVNSLSFLIMCLYHAMLEQEFDENLHKFI